ncbi:hypothetical protein [Paenibacillus ehimensis]|uniref:Lipoprotein n=1 Tax=Paenibacillus ehimensis TaxID=79264 RepID=A0ABT8V2N4_9BACL|nr:hypothetical protein [Paenibacillus ehimensis]MDO3675669.1 hypothetical protein [Paenibacillus ehimensis]
MKILFLRKLTMIVSLLALCSGCKLAPAATSSAPAESGTTTQIAAPASPQPPAQPPAAPEKPKQPEASQAEVLPTKPVAAQEQPIEGAYARAGENPLWQGRAEISKREDGTYHLEVNVTSGFAHHIGTMESDFTITSGKVKLLNEEYEDVSVTFAENRLVIDYPETQAFGGHNAEPRGTYYLFKSPIDPPFLAKLYDAAKIEDSYRGGFSHVWTVESDQGKQLLLLQSYSAVNRSNLVSEQVVVYNESSKQFNVIGEIDAVGRKKVADLLKGLGYSEDTVYLATRKAEFDRYQETIMQRFDNAGNDGLEAPLSEQEAFFIATGMEGKTSHADNRRNEDNMGSIFIQEVSSSNDEKVTIHEYEAVRNGDDDEHTATGNWIHVDRATGRVTDMFDE